ncbi:MmgE/PrpD family protein [Brevibacillus marinus]|uniref:MmgE/PrpD family protein n=1 Tax=Brevibacillus marinus TaxID=2496837 RepID=UPI000F825CA3|nr:MmgE/PrpD family protein [Brevibacillus marinus]
MSDRVSKALARFARRVQYESLPEQTVAEVKRRVIDTLGCLVSGYDADASIAARKLAERYEQPRGATIIGRGKKAAVDVAAFANGTAIRYLDYNDTYLSVEPLHPSDVIAPLLALAEVRAISAKRLIAAIAAAYEVGVIFCDEASLKTNGWDHVNYITLATVVGGANLLGLSEEETEQALALAIVPHAAMRQTRNGEISMWKGAAAANAARNAVFALQLAECGMKGPYEPFEGTMGMNYQLLNRKLNVDRVVAKLDACTRPQSITITYVKNWAVEYMTQSAIEAALALRQELASLDEVEHIHIETFQLAYDVLAKDQQKWAPKTRETADHSLPYIVMAALEDGKIDLDTFAPERLANQQTLERINSILTIEVSAEMNAGYPDGNPNRITITCKDGRVLQKLVKYPSGHRGNPMTDEQIEAKFRRLTAGYLREEQQAQALQELWKLEELTDYDRLFAHFTIEAGT